MPAKSDTSIGRLLRNNGLTIVLLLLFAVSVLGHAWNGFETYNSELKEHGQAPLESWGAYLSSGHFVGTLFENWESEFLQMALFVWLTSFLYQKGSSESKPPPGQPDEDNQYGLRYFKHQPVLRKLYENSLVIVLILFFFVSIALHAYGAMKQMNWERGVHGESALSYAEIWTEPEFWFESFQNWQSEFFSVAVLVVLSIFLRQKDSPQSKETDAPMDATGR